MHCCRPCYASTCHARCSAARGGPSLLCAGSVHRASHGWHCTIFFFCQVFICDWNLPLSPLPPPPVLPGSPMLPTQASPLPLLSPGSLACSSSPASLAQQLSKMCCNPCLAPLLGTGVGPQGQIRANKPLTAGGAHRHCGPQAPQSPMVALLTGRGIPNNGCQLLRIGLH